MNSNHIILAIYVTIWIIVLIILGLILLYEEQKPIGKQTALDLVIVDLAIINMLGITYWNFLLLLGHFEQNLELYCAIVLTILARFYFIILVASSQSFIFVKSLLIFHGQYVNDIPDEKLRNYCRKFAIIYSLVMFGVDRTMINPNNPILDILTDSTNKP